jgi:hypothetical protein
LAAGAEVDPLLHALQQAAEQVRGPSEWLSAAQATCHTR